MDPDDRLRFHGRRPVEDDEGRAVVRLPAATLDESSVEIGDDVHVGVEVRTGAVVLLPWDDRTRY